jgi:predicted regulator of Ras-like GTPase activity (Roadblock/LC7/MglB family)
MRFADLEPLIPTTCLTRRCLPDETVDLPADLVLGHIVPMLSLEVLAELAPDFVVSASEIIRLPLSRVALGYTIREQIINSTEPSWKTLESPLASPVASLNVFFARPPATQESDPSMEPEIIDAEPIPELVTEAPQDEAPLRKLSDLISNLPTFRRKTEETISRENAIITIKPDFPTLDTLGDEILPEQDALQSLFMTDEKLSTKRVVELCGDLPGIKSCLLTSDDAFIASQNVPVGLDIASLSSKATAMARAMHEVSADMGIGEIPALTLHTEKGPISVFQNESHTMLVFHADRGFIPGVREKVTLALGEVTRSRLCLPPPTNET